MGKVIKEKIYFDGGNGDRLAGYLEVPEQGEVRAYALFAHCFTCSKNIITATRIAAGLAERGIAILRFDFAGIGDSEGMFEQTNLSSNIEDLLAAYRFLETRYRAPALAIGHSLGGAALIRAAASMPATRAMATIAVPDDPSHMHHLLRDSKSDIEQQGYADVMIGGSQFRITQQFMNDVSQHNLTESLASLDKALLIMHSPGDQMVEIEHGYRLFNAASGDKSFVSLVDADHLLSNPAHAEYAVDLLAAWVAPYLL